MLLFHNIATEEKSLLQSYKSEHPILSLTINDEHTVAIGTAKGLSFLTRSRYNL